jgi:hypothetical protein
MTPALEAPGRGSRSPIQVSAVQKKTVALRQPADSASGRIFKIAPAIGTRSLGQQ